MEHTITENIVESYSHAFSSHLVDESYVFTRTFWLYQEGTDSVRFVLVPDFSKIHRFRSVRFGQLFVPVRRGSACVFRRRRGSVRFGSVRFRVRFRPVPELISSSVRFVSAGSVRFLIPSGMNFTRSRRGGHEKRGAREEGGTLCPLPSALCLLPTALCPLPSANIADSYFNVEIKHQESLQTIADSYFNVELKHQESLQTIADSYFKVELKHQYDLQHTVYL